MSAGPTLRAALAQQQRMREAERRKVTAPDVALYALSKRLSRSEWGIFAPGDSVSMDCRAPDRVRPRRVCSMMTTNEDAIRAVLVALEPFRDSI